MQDSPLNLSPEEMRRLGHALVDAVVDRWDGLDEAAPWAGAPRSELEPRFRAPCPEAPGDADDALARAVEEILPLAGRIDHPRFMAFVPSSPTWASLMGDWLAAGFNIFQGTWLASAGPSQIELVVLEWFREWLGMPEGAGGILTSGGSAANLIAAVAARQAAVDRGASLDSLSAYVGTLGHSSLERALRIAGYPEAGLHLIESDARGRMRIDRLEERIAADRAAGRIPALIAATAGATSTGAVDPLPELARLAAREALWLHVDAAYGGFAVLTEEGRRALEGLGEADSITLDPHKWLFQTFETGCLLARDPARLENAFRVFPDYLQDTELGMEHVNFSNRGLQLTRRFRALKIWMTLEVHGRRALAEEIAKGIAR
ncbi:MAG: aminotransferase class V-fold PLP-dependent enzyme, partial [Longimicrobiales bacterium]|nr:aminotransferase class V-fold PLP-dependent enzyme [Longimicrobiales bacterium]